jgi:hypothetical protein
MFKVGTMLKAREVRLSRKKPPYHPALIPGTSAEADHRPAARQRRHHDFAGFTMRNRRACLGIAYLDVAIGMNLITGLPAALKSNETEVRGAVTGTMC